ncbi:zinc-binding dehydrogenase [Streptomyces sp. NBC_01803]|uniref:zinc-binding dehydrogenase n=1 Tax=Streptomyces sp. NBC_01803 TaxID=2975946 RepID=UPI002DD8B5D8|nr:zinc-binding dehydrogenase [Streptomyces sp. NBC_01803]WSA45574.1 zinc-binding dehydrogenase [Streptomyces sp. NBC_01803]
MREIRVTEFGGPEVLVPVAVPDPEPGEGQVVVGVSVVDTIFVETQIRSGHARTWFPVQPPYVPGGGVAGHVTRVGTGVDPAWIGRAVITRAVVNGSYAEQVVAAADGLVAVPEGLGLPEAAALAHDGTTAMMLFGPAGVTAGQWVLITAAGGGMGLLLTQLAHAAGARVIGAARGARKLALIRELGAEVVVDYTEPGWTDEVRKVTGGAGVDVLWDGAGGEIGRAAFEVAADGARVSAHGAPSSSFAAIDPAEAARRNITLTGIAELQVSPADAVGRTVEAVEAAAAGRMRPHISRTFPLERAADAHAAIENRDITGKALLLVG